MSGTGYFNVSSHSLLAVILGLGMTVLASVTTSEPACAQRWPQCEGLCDDDNPCTGFCTCHYPDEDADVGYCAPRSQR